jgi:AcrR family transcriptional regulator
MNTPKKEHLLDVAEALFYRFGFHATGVDRIQVTSGVAKTTLYKHFPSKDDLIYEVLKRADARERAEIDRIIESSQYEGYELIQILLKRLVSLCEEDSFNGCLFANAAAEFMHSNCRLRDVFDNHLDWLRQRFTRILVESNADRAGALPLLVIYEGVLVVGRSTQGDELLASLEKLLKSLFS